MGKNIQIQLVDDHPIVRSGCRHFLEKHKEINIIVESSDGQEAIDDYATYQPDIVIMDLAMPNMGGMEAMQKILAQFPDARIIMLSVDNHLMISESLRSGAKGILSKSNLTSELIASIKAAQQGGNYIDTVLAKEVALKQLIPNTNKLSLLTKREHQLLLPLLKGNTIIQIAFDLRISPKTARVHKSNLMKKLSAQNMIELTQFGIKEGLLTI